MQPQRLGRYRILETLGRGATGDVYRAHDPQIDREIAIKTVRGFSELPEDRRREARARVLQEARAAGRLTHPNIVTIHDVGEADGLLYIAMERIEGETLDTFTGEGSAGRSLDAGEVVELVATAAETLDYAHRAGVIHRDVKPANLMRTAPGQLKVMDFGLALPPGAGFEGDNALMGTPSYMSPEQIRGETLDGRSDLFSLAVVLFELLAGEKPFTGRKIAGIVYRIVHEPHRDIAELLPDAPPELRVFFDRALAKERDDRYPDGATFAAALRELPLHAATLAPVAPPAASPTVDGSDAATVRVSGATPSAPAHGRLPATKRSSPPRSSPLPFIVALVVLLGGAAVAWFVFGERLGLREPPAPPAPATLTATVVTEPPGLEVLHDGVPLAPDGVVAFRADGPRGELTVGAGCREVRREVGINDADTEIVLVVEPDSVAWTFDPGVPGAVAEVNGEAELAPGESVELDLCRDNEIRVRADGYLPTSVELARAATPAEARAALETLRLTRIPRGTVSLPEFPYPVVVYVDGTRIDRGIRELRLDAGTHRVRLKNDTYWVDVTEEIVVRADTTVELPLAAPELTRLVVQAFPANCKVFLRRPGGEWAYVDDTPADRRIAVGTYEVRVRLNPTGETRETTVTLGPGDNPPVRVAFGRGS